jgi:hypothetical protein
MAGPLTRSESLRKSTVMQETIASFRAQGLGATRVDGSARLPSSNRSQRKHGFSAVDRAVVAVGILTAVASASFATYMATTDHQHPVFGGVEHLMIFARPNRGPNRPLIARIPAPGDDQGIDFRATGTIPGEAKEAVAPNYTLPGTGSRVEEILAEFTLQGVSGNVAMIENANGIYRVETGSALPGGGRVLGVEWRQGRFVVVTTRGIIREAQP